MADSLKSQAVKGVVWSAVERFSVQGIQFVLSIIIARLVAPSEYGLIAMLGIFLAIAQTFIDSGFSNALIQKKDRTEVDFSTVFYFNIVVSLVVYLILFLSAPYIALFYKEPLLDIITKWVGLNIIISALSIVQRAKLTIQLNFKTQAKASLIAVVISGICGITMAYYGYGVWALVCQSLLNNLLNTLFLWIFAHWYPLLVFSFSSFRVLFSFGSKLLFSGLLHTLYVNMYSLVIGRTYSSEIVGFYNRAYQFASFPSITIMGIISRVIYPIQCNIQNDKNRSQRLLLSYLGLCSFIMFPLLIIIAVVADDFVLLILSEKWLPSGKLLSILCISYLFYPLLMVNGSFLNSMGRSDLVLKAEFIKKAVAVAILLFTMPFGIEIVCWGFFLYNMFDYFIMTMYQKRILNVGFGQQILALIPIFALSFVLGLFLFGLHSLLNNLILRLVLCIFSGLLLYIGLAFVFRIEEVGVILKLKTKL